MASSIWPLKSNYKQMKKLKKYCAVILILSLYSCGDPSPTELIYDNTAVTEDLEIEIISPEPEEIVYTTGYDSTGIVQPVPQHLSNIYVSGIKNSFGTENIFINYYSAIFFDETQPVVNRHGRRVGFKTRMMGKVLFNNIDATEVPHIIQIREPGQIRNENAGMKYLHYERGTQNNFPFNADVDFKMLPMQMRDRRIEFDIPTPREITGGITKRGTVASGDLKLLLNWNNPGEGEIEIIIGGIETGRHDPFPLIRLKTKDDGELTIPASITKSIPFQNFTEIVFSFIRQKIKNDSSLSGLNDPFVVAQSIHNIKIAVQ